MAVTLAIETSQRCGGVALRAASGDVAVSLLDGSVRHDEALMPAVDALFEKLRTQPRAIETVGVSIGPGGFTGLRIAVATAKVLGLVTGASIAAVPSAVVAATSIAGLQRAATVLVASASKRERAWLTELKPASDGAWSIARTLGLVDAAALNDTEAGVLIADLHLPEPFRAACAKRSIAIVEPQFDPLQCLLEAERMAAAGQLITPDQLSPIYAREPEAVRKWRSGESSRA